MLYAQENSWDITFSENPSHSLLPRALVMGYRVEDEKVRE